MLIPSAFVKKKVQLNTKICLFTRAWVFYMNPGTVSMLRIVNFYSLIYYTQTFIFHFTCILVSLMIKCVLKVRKKAKIKNLYDQAPHPTQGTTQESDKNTPKHHIQESQAASLFRAGDHKATMNRQENITKTKHKQ